MLAPRVMCIDRIKTKGDNLLTYHHNNSTKNIYTPSRSITRMKVSTLMKRTTLHLIRCLLYIATSPSSFQTQYYKNLLHIRDEQSPPNTKEQRRGVRDRLQRTTIA